MPFKSNFVFRLDRTFPEGSGHSSTSENVIFESIITLAITGWSIVLTSYIPNVHFYA